MRPKRKFLELCVFLGRVVKAPQVRRVDRASKSKVVHFIQIRHRDEVEAPVTDWLREAYELSGVLSSQARRQVAGAEEENGECQAGYSHQIQVKERSIIGPAAVSSLFWQGLTLASGLHSTTLRAVAPVREVRVSPGDHVREGQTLIVLDGDDLAAGARAARSAALAAEQGSKAAAAELQAAEAGLALARASHDRIAGLQAKRSATAQELDDATAALRSAEARVAGASARALQAASAVESARAASDQASTTESFTTIAAPFDGVVTEKMVEPGNMASPGMPLLRLEDTRGFRLEVRVDESRIGQIRNGDSVPVFLGTGDHLDRGHGG